MDVLPNGDLKVNMFNITKEEPILNAKIYMHSIQHAEVLKFSCYEVDPLLAKKIDEDDALQHFEFDQYQANILNYYLECYKANRDPFLYKYHLIDKIDLDELLTTNPYTLGMAQQEQVIKDIYQDQYQRYHDYELALCEFSIDLPNKGKFVVAYRTLSFDPVNQTLHLGAKLRFNPSFYVKEVKHSLAYYTDMSEADFEEAYLQHKMETLEMIKQNFRVGELLNTRPEVVVLGYTQIDIARTLGQIDTDRKQQNLSLPLKALFGNVSLLDRMNRSRPKLVLYDNKVNIDQMRTVYNALKYPITYVQGPPGTGKTQTILNIVVNCITANKTLLISSNNNVPLDGISHKLDLGDYHGNKILFPALRLGNKQYMKAALKKIKELHEYDSRDRPKENLLARIKERSAENNKLLNERIEQYERRLELTEKLALINGLIDKGSYYLLEIERKKIEAELEKLPIISDADLQGIFEVIEGNQTLLQYFYFESLKYVRRLKTKAYASLIEIVYLDNEEEQLKQFNKWLGFDPNMELLVKVFPVIISTNLSVRRLGEQHKFDLLVIDEAGQCDIASSLLALAKCHNMVLIGDTNQLRPIVLFDEQQDQRLRKQFEVGEEYSYRNHSILSVYRGIDQVSNNILLSYHYRCAENIIRFCNQRFYENKLNLDAIKAKGNVSLLAVNNVNQKGKNAQMEEALEIVKYVEEAGLSDAFILTPFRNQEAVVTHYLNEAKAQGRINKEVSCGTIHKVQGQENKTIIISTAISKNTSARTYDWIKNNSELINVGVTRAKENLIVVTDRQAIDILSRKDDDLYALVAYAAKHGKIEVSKSMANRFSIGFSNDSQFENEFYKTMQHYCTTKSTLHLERNKKLVSLFPEEKGNSKLNRKEFDAVLYVDNKPAVVFEVNGSEHYKKGRSLEADRQKSALLESKGIRLILIPNAYVKHYEYLRELLKKVRGDAYQTELF